MMPAYVVDQIDVVTIADGSSFAAMDMMSPFVWKEGERYRIMVRAVPDPLRPNDPTGIIASGWSDDGLEFHLDHQPAIAPDTAPDAADAADAGGCEDPTVLVRPDGYVVYYTGVDARREQGAMVAAAGTSVEALTKRRVVLKAPPGEGISRKQRSFRPLRATGGYSTNMPPRLRTVSRRRGSAWRGPMHSAIRGSRSTIRSAFASMAGTIGICRPVRSVRCRGPTP